MTVLTFRKDNMRYALTFPLDNLDNKHQFSSYSTIPSDSFFEPLGAL